VCTLILLARVELIGHLPLFGIAFLLIACGGGRLRNGAARETAAGASAVVGR
jgi:hypothetical protein